MAVEHKYFIVFCVCVTDVRYHKLWLAFSNLNTILGFSFHELFCTHLLTYSVASYIEPTASSKFIAPREHVAVAVAVAVAVLSFHRDTQCIKLKLREITLD